MRAIRKQSNLREQANRLQVIDLATKRIAFWDQSLKVELAATTPGSDEQKQAKDKAYWANQRIRSDADRELQRLSWKEKTRQHILRERPSFTLNFLFMPGKPPSGNTKMVWYLDIVSSWLLFLAAVRIGVLFITTQNASEMSAQAWMGLILLVGSLSYFAGYMRLRAERLKHPQPNRPILDEI